MPDLLIIFIPIIIGFLFVSNLFPKSIFSDFLLKLTLGTGFGIGISSSLFFLWILIFKNHAKEFFLVEIALILLLAFLLWRKPTFIQTMSTTIDQ